MGKPIITYRKSELYDQVVDEYEVFASSYHFLMFLAIIGYREGRLKQNNYRGDRDEGTRGEIGLQNVYSNELYRTIMACLALQETGDPDALVDSSKQMKILAQYAAGGLEVAEQEFGDIAGDPTDAIVNYIKRVHEDNNDIGGELDAIVKSFDDEMLDSGE
ncbi:hypothetical protein [Halarchaeum salinum]|uniref:Dnd system-associated protein 4 n=1 Tax=Halarchaeum salinum TaxID=489912 RepID=A0AAV3S4U5_9EURY